MAACYPCKGKGYTDSQVFCSACDGTGIADPAHNRNLFALETVAGAVAREINRADCGHGAGAIEGDAYKAAFDRAGSDARKHIVDAHCDSTVMFDLEYNGHTL